MFALRKCEGSFVQSNSLKSPDQKGVICRTAVFLSTVKRISYAGKAIIMQAA